MSESSESHRLKPVPAFTAPQIRELALARVKALGFTLAGVCPARSSDFADEYQTWLAQGKHATMEYLEQYVNVRLDPSRIMPDVKSMLCVADLYAPRVPRSGPSSSAEATTTSEGEPIGLVARYARGRDYHQVIKRRLHTLADELRELIPGSDFRTVVDSAPVLEREHAARAGLGWVGRHTLLINPRIGSWFLLGCVLSNIEIEPTPPSEAISSALNHPDHCGTCTRCIDACPTNAIARPTNPDDPSRSVDASRCISYLTIEHQPPIDERFHRALGTRVFGCDICQEVCPHNTQPADQPALVPNASYASRLPQTHGFKLLDMLSWTEEIRRTSFGPSALKRATHEMFKRNALLAAANAIEDRIGSDQARAELLDRINEHSKDLQETEQNRALAKKLLERLERAGS